MKSIQGISGNTVAPLVGTVTWKIKDNTGRVHTLVLPNMYYAPNALYRLLSPLHWRQNARDDTLCLHGTWCAMYDDSLVLWWCQQQYKYTVPLQQSTNVAMLYSAPGSKQFAYSCCLLKNRTHQLAFPSMIELRMDITSVNHQVALAWPSLASPCMETMYAMALQWMEKSMTICMYCQYPLLQFSTWTELMIKSPKRCNTQWSKAFKRNCSIGITALATSHFAAQNKMCNKAFSHAN